jgi:hypothetical protein
LRASQARHDDDDESDSMRDSGRGSGRHSSGSLAGHWGSGHGIGFRKSLRKSAAGLAANWSQGRQSKRDRKNHSQLIMTEGDEEDGDDSGDEEEQLVYAWRGGIRKNKKEATAVVVGVDPKHLLVGGGWPGAPKAARVRCECHLEKAPDGCYVLVASALISAAGGGGGGSDRFAQEMRVDLRRAVAVHARNRGRIGARTTELRLLMPSSTLILRGAKAGADLAAWYGQLCSRLGSGADLLASLPSVSWPGSGRASGVDIKKHAGWLSHCPRADSGFPGKPLHCRLLSDGVRKYIEAFELSEDSGRGAAKWIAKPIMEVRTAREWDGGVSRGTRGLISCCLPPKKADAGGACFEILTTDARAMTLDANDDTNLVEWLDALTKSDRASTGSDMSGSARSWRSDSDAAPLMPRLSVEGGFEMTRKL